MRGPLRVGNAEFTAVASVGQRVTFNHRIPVGPVVQDRSDGLGLDIDIHHRENGMAGTLPSTPMTSSEPFRAVLVNAVMSGTDGFTLASWINNNRDLAGSVILMISGVDRQEMAQRCEQVKAIYVEKPVSQADLLDALARAIGGEAAVRSAPIEPKVGEISTVTTKPLRVLVAEDNPPNQKFIVLALQSRGHHVEAASTGQEALDLLRQHDFDAVLMDLQMPVMDGLEATATIRKLAEPSKANVPIIALTAHAMRGDEERCLAAGMDAYISKPVNVADLFAVLERSAESPGSPSSGKEAEEPQQPS